MKLSEFETVYRVFDSGNCDFEPFYGTQDDIVEYLREQGDYDDKQGWVKGLEKWGLTFEIIN